MYNHVEFDGILLKPCLLQPCFHVAGKVRARLNQPDSINFGIRLKINLTVNFGTLLV